MSFAAWANRVWIRVRYSYTEERRNKFAGSVTGGGTLEEIEEYRNVERITAHCEVQGVDSQTVLGALSTTLPTIKYGGSGTDTLSGTTGWTFQTPQIEDTPGGNSDVMVTWERATAWAEVV